MKTINFIFLQLLLQDEIQIKKKEKNISSTKKGMIRKNTTCTGTMTNASCVSNRSSLLPCVENKKNKLKGRRCHSRDRKENTRREVTLSHHLATRSHWTHGVRSLGRMVALASGGGFGLPFLLGDHKHVSPWQRTRI